MFKPRLRPADSHFMKNRNALLGLLILVVALLLSGCSSKNALWVHENLALTENFHAGTKILVTPKIPDTGSHEARLRATAHTRGKRVGAVIELVVLAEFDDFSFLDRVSFASGRAFPLTVINRVNEDCGTTDMSLCNVHEHVSVKLSRKYLVAKRAMGFDVKFWGRRDSVMFFVPPQYIEGLLARMDNRAPEELVTSQSAASQKQRPMPASPATHTSTRR